MRNFKRVICILIVLVMTALLLVSCNAGSKTDNNQDIAQTMDKTTDQSGKESETGGGVSDPEPNTLPIAKDKEVELTIYSAISDFARQFYTGLEEHPVVKEMEKQTGLKFKFIHPPKGDDGTFFNTLLASGEYPDLFRTAFGLYPGGPDGAVQDGILINMNDLIQKYAPNYLSLIDEKGPAIKRKIFSDSGMIIRFGTIFQPPFLEGKVQAGIVVRTDLLEKLNLTVPETIDEMTDVLRALKKEVEVPLALPNVADFYWNGYNIISSAFGLTHTQDGYFINNGKVEYSPIQPEYKEYLQLLNLWYKEGLIDKDFVNKTTADAQKMLVSGKAAMAVQHQAHHKQLILLCKNDNPIFEFGPVPYLRKTKGEQLHLVPQMESVDSTAWFVSTSCKYPVEAVKFIDYLYMKDTQQLTAWGVNTEQTPIYEIKDGVRIFTDFMQNNKDMDFTTARHRYTLPTLQIMWDEDMEKQNYDLPVNQKSFEVWGENCDTADLYPAMATMSADESREYAAIMNQVNTYNSEMFYKFIMGLESIDKFDDYVKQINSYNISRAIEIKQKAYDHYITR